MKLWKIGVLGIATALFLNGCGKDCKDKIINPSTEDITAVSEVKNFESIKTITEGEAIEKGLLNYIGEDVDKAYIEKVKGLTIRKELVKNDAKDLKIIYTPIHGSGNIPVRRVLKELGYENVKVVKEQELPKGDFPSAP